MDHIEITDKWSTLRGPPRAAGLFRIPELILVWFWPLTQPVRELLTWRFSSMQNQAPVYVVFELSFSLVLENGTIPVQPLGRRRGVYSGCANSERPRRGLCTKCLIEMRTDFSGRSPKLDSPDCDSDRGEREVFLKWIGGSVGMIFQFPNHLGNRYNLVSIVSWSA
eukprot:COSAG02_NODE_795_length_17133_cov_6.577727_19_plen_166_part_00